MHATTASPLRRSTKLTFSRRAFFLFVPCILTFLFVLRPHPLQAQIVWEPHSVETCIETSCLYHSPFSAYIPLGEARTAHQYLRAYLNRNVTTPIPRLLQRSSKIPQCSVIGGAPAPRDPFHAELIDSTLTIRLNNRHPSFMTAEGITTSLGERTDILMLQRGALRSLERYIYGWGQGNLTLANQRLLAGERVKKNPPLLLYRTECPSRLQACPLSLQALNISTAPEWLPLWLLHPEIETITRNTLQQFDLSISEVATTGITAVMTALRLCKQVNLFALNGLTKGDGDYKDLSVWKGHRLDKERKFLHWLSTCSPFQSRWCGRVKVFS